MEKIGWPHATIAVVILIIILVLLGYTFGAIEFPGGGKIVITPPPRSVPSLAFATDVSPGQAVRAYYEAINNRQYETTWAMLSDAFKKKFNCCNSDGSFQFDKYIDWWDSVAQVEIGEVRIVEQTNNAATVVAELTYLMKSGKTIYDNKPRIRLVRDVATRAWLFDDKGP